MKKALFILTFLVSFYALSSEKEPEPEQVYLRGTFNNWADDTKMHLNNQGNWLINVSLKNGAKFKFDIHGDWSENYGDNSEDGVSERDGNNINISDAGNYTVEFNYKTKAYRVMVHYYTVIYGPVWHQSYVANLPVKIFHNGELYNQGNVYYTSSNGAIYFTRLPVNKEFTIEVGGLVEGHYQPGGVYRPAEYLHGEKKFVTTVSSEPQKLYLKRCQATSLSLIREPASEKESPHSMQCINGVWQGNLDLTARSENNSHRSFTIIKDISTNPTVYGDDTADGIIAINENAISVTEDGEHQITINLKTMEYDVVVKNMVTFSTHLWIEDGCWLEVRGDKEPLRWEKGLSFDNKLGGEAHREKTVAMKEGPFEYKYTKICQNDDNVYWELRDNRLGPSAGTEAPIFN
jgi:hypothetical protein